jgi:hypothetical protein
MPNLLPARTKARDACSLRITLDAGAFDATTP